jgi:hypothetical protein
MDEKIDTTGPDACLEVCNVLVDSINAMRKELKDIYTDAELPLAERWYFFCKVPGELQEIDPSIYRFTEWEAKNGRIEWYENFDIDKYQEVSFIDLIEDQIASYFYEDGELVTGDALEEALADMKPFTPDNLESFKEAVLNSGYHGFIFDW